MTSRVSYSSGVLYGQIDIACAEGEENGIGAISTIDGLLAIDQSHYFS